MIDYLKLISSNYILVAQFITISREKVNWQINKNYLKIWGNVILNLLAIIFLNHLSLILGKTSLWLLKVCYNSLIITSKKKEKSKRSNHSRLKTFLLISVYQLSIWLKLWKNHSWVCIKTMKRMIHLHKCVKMINPFGF